MFLIESNGEKAIAPGYLMGYSGEAMMADYGRYEATFPLFFIANLSVLGWSAFSVLRGGNSSIFLAFAFFMGIYSVKMFTQRLVRVRFDAHISEIRRAPFLANLNTAVLGITLALIGFKYQALIGEFDTLMFKIIGWIMMGVASSYFLALRNVSRKN